MRTCRQCEQDKPLTDYWRCKRCRMGRDYTCGECQKANKRKREMTPAGIYAKKCRVLTTIFRYRFFDPWDKERFQLDHKFSIRAGFDHNVPLYIINNVANLELVTKRANRRKGQASSITLQTLYDTVQIDPLLAEMASYVDAVDCRDTLQRWGLIAHELNEQKRKASG